MKWVNARSNDLGFPNWPWQREVAGPWLHLWPSNLFNRFMVSYSYDFLYGITSLSSLWALTLGNSPRSFKMRSTFSHNQFHATSCSVSQSFGASDLPPVFRSRVTGMIHFRTSGGGGGCCVLFGSMLAHFRFLFYQNLSRPDFLEMLLTMFIILYPPTWIVVNVCRLFYIYIYIGPWWAMQSASWCLMPASKWQASRPENLTTLWALCSWTGQGPEHRTLPSGWKLGNSVNPRSYPAPNFTARRCVLPGRFK